ncbi:sugar transferase [Erythrobacter sp. YT30]|uniref:sugar transferase n=1 Tax=Erythrobacter sp. YT30 TaxID=1735012 RepID=UPI000ABE3B5E|nr:sugar transferase [Erythrobacter sp. YT30]
MNEQTGLLLDANVTADLHRGATPSLEKRRLRAYAAMVVADLILIQACFGIASLIYESQWWEPRAMLAAHILLPLYFTIALYNNTYSTHSLSNWPYGARKAVFALVISAALVNFIAFYTKSNAEFSRASVTIGFGLTVLALIGLRRGIPIFIDRFWEGRTRNELVITDGGPAFALPGATTISAKDLGLDPSSGDPFIFDRVGKLLRNQDRVVVTCPDEKRHDWSILLKSSGVFGEVVSATAHSLGATGLHHYGSTNQTTLVVSNGPLGMRARLTKRLFDTVIAALALLLLSPLLVLVAAVIKLEDGGPVFFVQRRMEKGNRLFDIIKFRSMRLVDQDDSGLQSTGRQDARITRIGAFIRKKQH